ncbi:MAG: AI-2E family transporter [Oscillospiraceae bacterium]|nr:AI-2E family transporter [Oscillospiraceae bacterium]
MKDNQINETKVKDKKYIKIFILAAAILLTVKIMFDFSSFTGIFTYISGIIRPFIFGFIIAYCINIPVSWLEEQLKKLTNKPALSVKIKNKNIVRTPWMQKAARPISIVLNLIALIGFIVFGLWNLIPMILENVQQLIAEMPGYIGLGIRELKRFPLSEELGLGTWLDSLNVDDLSEFFPSADDFIGMATGVFSGIFTAFLTIVATLYFLAEYNKVKDFIKRMIDAHSPRKQRHALKYIRLVDFSFRKFLTCQFLDSLILGTITMVQFTIMGSPYAVTLGLMLGVLNIIPYFGSIFGSVVAVFIIWATSGIDTAVIVAIMLLITQQIDGNFINPKIMGSSFKISPVLVIIAITIGGAIGNVMGMIFAIPVANVLKTILEEYIKTKEQQRVDNAPTKAC